MTRRFELLALTTSLWLLGGCALVHRYPTYMGKVLELQTDKPIERAGVLVSYWSENPSVGGWVPHYLGYQWALTNAEGKFEIPARIYLVYHPFERFISRPNMTVFKRGYGNFPSSFHGGPGKHGKIEPELDRFRMPGGKEVTFWLPKLDTPEEIRDHNLALPWILYGPVKLPAGMSRGEFKELFGQE